ncbi:MAG: recombinase family protein [Alphaproteobacteria bacterium PRO2]|nr:recombinase family protein [Alphaproteobacteria bacterium PRO2]
MKPPIKYCAVYTRKSTEEGLEQDFNTLDAQREACLSYIASQKAEGWVPVPDAYDDGGFSGGTLDRPALKRLMDDIKAGKVHIVVVYKIDRLTRALMDFSKLVEVFDQYGVTFVSITQSFNTTTSMGRLTLNVLLSFAQFEREVIGERVRDKIAASKKKGMWMGGNPPLGYDIQYRQLVPNKSEAKTVNYIFERYLTLGNVIRLKQELDRDGIVSKVLTYKDGRAVGGKPFSRGALYALLSNPICIGQIRHKNKTYDGQHDGIISIDLWAAVQQKLQQQASIYKGQKISREVNLLKGLLFDAHGILYTPGYTAKGNKQYRYYISQNLVQMRDHPDDLLGRLPAHEIESAVEGAIRVHLSDREKISSLLGINLHDEVEAIQKIADTQAAVSMDQFVKACIEQITVQTDKLEIKIKTDGLSSLLSDAAKVKINSTVDIGTLLVPYTTRRAKKGALVIAPEKQQKDIFDLPSNELKKLVQGFIWRDEHFSGMTLRDIAKREEFSEGYVGQCIFQTFEISLA